ncbi:MAG: nitroreductase [Sphingomonadaceae bacterium]
MSVSDAVLSRRSVRAFRPDPVPLEIIQRALDKARWSASGCNFQPWEATVITGEPLKALQAKIADQPPQDPAEYIITPPDLPQRYAERLSALGAKMYGSMDIGRADTDARAEVARQNAFSFGAPALLLVHIPRSLGPAQWFDVGQWFDAVMLLLREEGVDTCAQQFMAMWARIIKDHIGIPDDEQMLFCGLAIGYADRDAPVNAFERERVPLSEQVRFIGFD